MPIRRLEIGSAATRPLQDRIIHAINRAGGRALFVGGCVRDALWGRSSEDVDIEVFGLAPDVVSAVLRDIAPVNHVGDAFGVFKVQGAPIDVSLPRRESKVGRGHRAFDVCSDPSMSLSEAASRRDFTMNAMSYDPRAQDLCDPFDGLRDLTSRTLRHVSGKFAEDPLRVLRGMQFAGRFRLEAVQETTALCAALREEYSALAVERVWGEWFKWATQSVAPSAGLTFLHQCRWAEMYPDLARLDGCVQDPIFHPEGDVWTHTRYAVDRAADIAEREQLPLEERAVLVLSALCHDLGKPETTEIVGDRVRSYGHTGTTATFRRFLMAIGAPERIIARVVRLCEYHLTHIDFAGSAKHVRRVARALGEAGETMTMLARLVEADHSARPPLAAELPERMAGMLDVAATLDIQDSAPQPLLRGRDLLAIGMKPGPAMGRALQAAFEAQLEGEFTTFDEGLLWVRQRESIHDAENP